MPRLRHCHDPQRSTALQILEPISDAYGELACLGWPHRCLTGGGTGIQKRGAPLAGTNARSLCPGAVDGGARQHASEQTRLGWTSDCFGAILAIQTGLRVGSELPLSRVLRSGRASIGVFPAAFFLEFLRVILAANAGEIDARRRQFQAHLVHGSGDGLRHGQVAELLVIRRDDVPRGMPRARQRHGVLVCLDILRP